ncbi:MAG TPA: CBS domain-containing protein, partial [Sphingobium sp.]
MSITAILQGKGREVTQVRSDDSVLSVVQLLSERRIGCVPVVDDGQVVGIFSERDLVHHVARDGAAVLDRKVGDVMTAPPITTDDKTPIIHCLSLMTKKRVRHLPVVVDGALVGLVSIGDLVKFRIDSIESEAAA